MHSVHHSPHILRWAGVARVAAAGAFFALVGATAVVDIAFMTSSEQAIEAATTPVLPVCTDHGSSLCVRALR